MKESSTILVLSLIFSFVYTSVRIISPAELKNKYGGIVISFELLRGIPEAQLCQLRQNSLWDEPSTE